jgi:site-specific DNA recombinase
MAPSIPNAKPKRQALASLPAVSTPRRVAVYCRVSSEEQRDKQTIDTQVDLAQKWVDFEKLAGRPTDISDWYLDDGVSGFSVLFAQRPAGQRLLTDAGDGKFDLLIVYKTDRLGREPRDILNAVHDIAQHDVAVKSLTEDFDLSTPAGKFMFNMLAASAGFARDQQLERMHDGKNHWAREGKWVGGSAPYGYAVLGFQKDSSLVVSDTLIDGLTLSTAEVVRMIYRWLAEEGRSCIKIAEQLNAMGVPTAYTLAKRSVTRQYLAKGNATGLYGLWTGPRVRNLVIDTVYKGEHRFGKRASKTRSVIVRQVPALVDADTWERAQQALTRNQLLATRNAKRQYLLRGLITCGLCDTRYSGMLCTRRNGRARAYYVCGGKHPHRGRLVGRCPSKHLPAEELEERIWQTLEDYIKNPGPILDQLALHMQQREHQAADLDTERRGQALALSRLADQKESMLDLYRRKLITPPDLERQLAKIAADEAEITTRLTTLERTLKGQVTMASKLTEARALLTQWCETLEEHPSWDKRRAVVEGLIVSIQVEPPRTAQQTMPDIIVTYAFGRRCTVTCTHVPASALPPLTTRGVPPRHLVWEKSQTCLLTAIDIPPPGTRLLLILARSMTDNQGAKNGEGAPLNWRPSADAVAGAGMPNGLKELHPCLTKPHSIGWGCRNRAVDAKDGNVERVARRDRVAQDQALGHVKTLDRRRAGSASSTRQFAIHPDFGIVVNTHRQHDLRTRWIKGTNPGRDRQLRAKPQEGHFAAAALRLQFGREDDGPRRVVEIRFPSVWIDVVGSLEFRHGVRNRWHFNDFCLPSLPLRTKNGRPFQRHQINGTHGGQRRGNGGLR